MKTRLALSILSSYALFTAACSPESATLRSERPLQDNRIEFEEQAGPDIQTFDWITEDGGQSQLDFNPRVDILFVADNSESMRTAQNNLATNMERFTKKLVGNRMIDYHIGVISVWEDSERFLTKKKDEFGIGELRYVKNSSGQAAKNRRFLTKHDNSSLLAPTLKIGVAPYADGGPEFEEFFSPLSAALDKTGRGAANEGFFRDDAQLVVIFLTDADDSSKNISPDQMAQKLIAFKGDADKVSVYGVLVRASDDDKYKDWDLRVHPKYHPECFDMTKKTPVNNGKCKDGFGPERIESLIMAANAIHGTPAQIKASNIMSIVSPRFGDELGRIGDNITVKTLEKEIFLSQRPRVQDGQLMIRVRYGKQSIPQKDTDKGTKGWLYNPETNSILLSGDIDYVYEEGARFAVDLIPLTLRQSGN